MNKNAFMKKRETSMVFLYPKRFDAQPLMKPPIITPHVELFERPACHGPVSCHSWMLGKYWPYSARVFGQYHGSTDARADGVSLVNVLFWNDG